MRREGRNDKGRHPPARMVLVRALACAALGCAVLAGAGPAAGAGASVRRSPLARWQYSVRGACSTPLPAQAACMASELVPASAEARAHHHPLGLPSIAQPQAPSPAAGDYGLRPQDLRSGYGLPLTAPGVQTVAIVDAYNDPAAEADLAAFGEEFGLRACTSANGCFKQVNEKGETANLPFPKTAAELTTARATKPALAKAATGWGLEISLDVETVHAVCQTCHIVLVEAASPQYSRLEAAEAAAESLGAREISNSWGGHETGQTEASERKSPFDHPGTVITASAGDSGYLDWDSTNPGAVEYPAASPHVVAVGGTRLELTAKGAWAAESVWNGQGAGGGGCSTIFKAPAWQSALSSSSGVGCGGDRAVADISADADPYTGVAVTDSLNPGCEYAYTEAGAEHVQHWCTIGGTSLASPLIAAVFALAGGPHGVEYPAATLYANASEDPASLHDVTAGSNGECSEPHGPTGLSGCTAEQEAVACEGQARCLAGSGYDGPSGLGTPDGIAAFQPAGSEELVTGGEAGGEPTPPSGSQGPTGAGASGSGAGGSPEAAGGSAGAAAPPEQGIVKPEPSAGEADVISALALTPASARAARATHRRLSQVDFSFLARFATQVRVSLAKRIAFRHRARWQALHRSASLAARRGRNTDRLATGPLTAGTYRLTLTPRQGAARSLIIRVR